MGVAGADARGSDRVRQAQHPRQRGMSRTDSHADDGSPARQASRCGGALRTRRPAEAPGRALGNRETRRVVMLRSRSYVTGLADAGWTWLHGAIESSKQPLWHGSRQRVFAILNRSEPFQMAGSNWSRITRPPSGDFCYNLAGAGRATSVPIQLPNPLLPDPSSGSRSSGMPACRERYRRGMRVRG